MNTKLSCALQALALVASTNALAEGEWNPSTLSDASISQAQAAKLAYQQCLDAEMQKSLASSADSRALTDAILNACEDRLKPIRTAYDAEKVPASITDRYLKQLRSRGAQSVVREIMAVQAVRQANTDAAKHAP
jgi:hypothetical protein